MDKKIDEQSKQRGPNVTFIPPYRSHSTAAAKRWSLQNFDYLRKFNLIAAARASEPLLLPVLRDLNIRGQKMLKKFIFIISHRFYSLEILTEFLNQAEGKIEFFSKINRI